MFFPTASIAVLGFVSCASAHMKMSKPVPYANAQLNNSPLDATGADFPCKMMFDTTTPATSMALGSTQDLDFIGGATHGGGSCQVSITYDNPPTKNSVFKVIHSIEGGCPTRNNPGNIGNDASSPDPDTYSFTIPTGMPTGKATLAWTWFNKVGNREMYMNCAPIDITGGSSKRSEEEENLVRGLEELVARDQAFYKGLPNMFVANIGNGCGTQDSTDLLFPNPGDSIDKPGSAPAFATPTGSGCQAVAAFASNAGSISALPTTMTSAPAASAGVFVTIPASSAAKATTMATSTVAPAAPSSPAAPASPSSAATPVPAPSASSAASPAPSPSSPPSGASGAMTAGSACSPEGLWNCVGGNSFQRCGSGTWSVIQQLAAGTQCKPGQSSAINITAVSGKRAIRFSSDHIRRHVHRSS